MEWKEEKDENKWALKGTHVTITLFKNHHKHTNHWAFECLDVCIESTILLPHEMLPVDLAKNLAIKLVDKRLFDMVSEIKTMYK